MKIYLRNIVCPDLENLGVNYKIDELGIEITSSVSDGLKKELDKTLQPCNIVLISENNSVTAKKIKSVVRELLHYSDDEMRNMLPSLIQARKTSYTYLDNLFHLETGITIEEYFNKKKIEWAKKLLAYYNLTITEVTYQLGYISSNNFIEQFRLITGITPYQFKKAKSKQQISILEEV